MPDNTSFELPYTEQPLGIAPLIIKWEDRLVAFWKPFAGPVGPADGSGFGAYAPSRTDVAGKYPFHGYYTNGSSELDILVTSDGYAWKGDGSTKKGYTLSTPDLTASNFTRVIRFRLSSVTGDQILFGQFNPSQSPIYKYGLGFMMSGSTLYAACSNNNATQVASIAGLVIDVWYTAVFTRNGTELKLWLSNGSYATGTGSAAAFNYAAEGFLGTGVSAASFTATANAYLSAAGIWSYDITDSAAISLLSNIWQVFSPVTVEVPYTPPAPASKTLNFDLPFTSQPTVPVEIDRTNPLGAKVIAATFANNTDGSVSGPAIFTSYGRAAALNISVSDDALATGPYTIATRLSYTTGIGTTYAGILGIARVATWFSNMDTCEVSWRNTLGARYGMTRKNSDASNPIASAAVSYEVPSEIVVSSTAGAGVFYEGASGGQTLVRYGTAGTFITGVSRSVYAGDANATFAPYLVVFSGALTDAERLEFRNNPWQIYKPQEIPVSIVEPFQYISTYKDSSFEVPWTEQPTIEVDIDRTNFFGAAVETMWIPGVLGTKSIGRKNDLVASANPGTNEWAAVAGVNGIGRRSYSGLTLTYRTENNLIAGISASSPITVLLIGQANDSTTNDSFSVGIGSQWTGIGLGWIYSSSGVVVGTCNSASFDGNVTIAHPRGSYTAAFSLASGTLSLAVNGDKSATDSSFTVPNTTNWKLEIGCNFWANPYGDNVVAVVVLNKKFTESELKELTANPWQVVGNRQISSSIVQTLISPDLLSNPQTSNITTTTVTPAVTLTY